MGDRETPEISDDFLLLRHFKVTVHRSEQCEVIPVGSETGGRQLGSGIFSACIARYCFLAVFLGVNQVPTHLWIGFVAWGIEPLAFVDREAFP